MRVWGVEEDRREFAEFYAAARDECLRVVLISVGDRVLAENLVAEAFTRAWMSWRKVRRHPAPRAWVVRTALNAHVSGSVFLLMGGRGASKPLNWSWTITAARIPPGARFVISTVPAPSLQSPNDLQL